MCGSDYVYTSSMLASVAIVMHITYPIREKLLRSRCVQLCHQHTNQLFKSLLLCFIAAFGASQRNAYYLHGVRNYEFGVGLCKVVEHNTLAVVGAWP